MKVIGTEEHFILPPKPGATNAGRSEDEPAPIAGCPLYDNFASFISPDIRLQIMDKNGVDVQILSTPFGQDLPAEISREKVREVNDYAASLVAQHPDRFVALAAIPTSVPEACTVELEYCVKELHFKGAIINNRVAGDKFLSEPEYDDFLALCEEYDLPIFLHPGKPPKGVTELCYSSTGLSPVQTSIFSRFGYGWHIDVGIHALNMMLTGVFDRHPKLQIILGHWGEQLPFFLERFDAAMPGELFGLQREIRDYMRENVYVTSSGVQSVECMDYCKKVLGADRLMYSADYPFTDFKGQEKLLANPSFTPEELELFAHRNAERLFHL